MALDASYAIPIYLRRFYANHPDVMFKPGPFYMGDGWLGWFFNVSCIVWVVFICVIFSMPTLLPVTPDTMNYAAVSHLSYMNHGTLYSSNQPAHYLWCRFPRTVRRSPFLVVGPKLITFFTTSIWYFSGYASSFFRAAHNADQHFYLPRGNSLTG